MKYLAITGFYGTGSSGVIDFLDGNPDFAITPNYTYEHVLFYYPDSVFDLEWKLLYNNDLHRSNEAILSFKDAIKKLKKNFGWFGSYDSLFGNRFDQIVEQYINSLIDYKHGLISYINYKNVRFSILKLFAQLVAHIFFNRRIYKYGRQYVYDKNASTQIHSMPASDVFYNKTKEFSHRYASLFAKENKISVFDHLILPYHINRIDKMFDDDFSFILVTRDPRDLFILCKYIYKSKNPFPENVDDFCVFYKNLQNYICKSDRVLVVRFEDLIYQKEKVSKSIFDFCGVANKEYTSKFVPEQSINNTQVFLLSEKWQNEIKVIENELGDYLYPFPYERVPDKNGIFE